MRCYAILAGGGVKGPALAGCLQEAQERGIVFAGYGGASAGAIVATLAAVGYKPSEILAQVETRFRLESFVSEDSGRALRAVQNLESRRFPQSLPTIVGLVRRMWKDLGLYDGRQLRVVLTALMREKLSSLRHVSEISFQDLADAGCPPLKILATDIDSRTPVVFSAAGGREQNGSVVDAVRASISYPFMFKPVVSNDRLLVDGGLCSNLPILLFAQERRADRLPVFAFDLTSLPGGPSSSENLLQFSWSLLQAAVDSSDHLARWASDDIHYVPVVLPAAMGPFASDPSDGHSAQLFELGRSAVSDYFGQALPDWSPVADPVRRIQSRHQSSVVMVEAALRGCAQQFERDTEASEARAFVLLRNESGGLSVVYESPVAPSEMARGHLFDTVSGCIGFCYEHRVPCMGDLEGRESEDFANDWQLVGHETFPLPISRRALYAFPIFDTRSVGARFASTARTTSLVGVLCVDSSTRLRDTGWMDTNRRAGTRLGTVWADVLARILV